MDSLIVFASGDLGDRVFSMMMTKFVLTLLVGVVVSLGALVAKADAATREEFPGKEYFKEPNAKLTLFTKPEDHKKVEAESEGAGWRYFEANAQSNRVLIFNHPWSGVRHDYRKYGKKKGHDLHLVSKWFAAKGINFFAALRKNTNTDHRKKTKAYGISIEPLEVFYHLTKKVELEFGRDVQLCYYGHSAGAAAPLFTSAKLNKRNQHHVSSAPENCMGGGSNNRFFGGGRYCQWKFWENDYKSAKNLTIIIGGNELKNPKEEVITDNKYIACKERGKQKECKSYYKRQKQAILYHKTAMKFSSDDIKVEVVGNLNHQTMSVFKYIDEWGTAVLKGCGFEN